MRRLVTAFTALKWEHGGVIMALKTTKINFNNPKILEGYVAQIPEGWRERVGTSGGLVHRLFPQPFLFGESRAPGQHRGLPIRFRIYSRSEMESVKNYWDVVTKYVDDAGNHASRYGFGLVKISDDGYIMEGISLDDCIYHAGIGSSIIESAERLYRFFEMVKPGKLDEQYQMIVEKAEKFPFIRDV